MQHIRSDIENNKRAVNIFAAINIKAYIHDAGIIAYCSYFVWVDTPLSFNIISLPLKQL